jgi:hypothetical protein
VPTTERTALNPAEKALALHAPERRCRPWTYQTADIDGLRAAIICPANDGADTVVYYKFRSQEAMDSSYKEVRKQWGVRNSGQCGTKKRSESLYNIGNRRNVGRLLCIPKDTNGNALIYWTNNRLSILSLAFRNDDNIKVLYRWWQNDAGPKP